MFLQKKNVGSHWRANSTQYTIIVCHFLFEDLFRSSSAGHGKTNEWRYKKFVGFVPVGSNKTSGSSLLTTDYKTSIHENREAVSQRSKVRLTQLHKKRRGIKEPGYKEGPI